VTWLFVAATIALGVCAFKWAITFLDEREKETPLRPRVWEYLKGEPQRFRRTCDGLPARQFKLVQRYKKERACVRQAEQ
jgi:hypothetical protein